MCSAARDQFLEENILAAQLRSGGGGTGPTSPISITPAANSPDTGRTPTASPDLLVHKPTARVQIQRERQGQAKKPQPKAVNKAFLMGAEAFARTSIAVPRPKVGAAARVNVQPGRAQAQPTGVGGRGTATSRVAGVQRSIDSGSTGSVASPRLVHVGGFTPRVPLRDKGRTESKQTILSKDSDSLTTVGT
nr:hypothetical protein BaRGS_012632 [Batillaria attramentaria]